MALDFPASPTDGQIYNNFIWSSATNAWKARPSYQQTSTQSPTAPTSPNAGDIWIDTTDGSSFYWYDDGTSKQWVELVSSGIPSTPVSVATGGTGATTVAGAQTNLQIPLSQNYIINGGFDIWQRGVGPSAAGLGLLVYLADRWFTYRDGSGSTATVSQIAFTPGTAPVQGYEGTYFLRYSQTVAGTGGSSCNIGQRIENVRTLAGQTATLSFWAKADATRTITPTFFRGFGSGGSTGDTALIGTPITVGTSWARYSQTVNIPSVAGKTIGDGSYLETSLVLAANTVQTIDIWGVQLEQGSVATPFRRNAPSIQAELAACQRYYLRLAPGVQYGEFGSGVCVGTPWVAISSHFPVAMRIPPTSFEYSSLAHFRINHGNTVLTPLASFYTDSMGINSARLIATHASATPGTSCLLELVAGNTTGYIAFSAEL